MVRRLPTGGIMAFNHIVTIVRDKRRVTHRFTQFNRDTCQMNPVYQVRDFVAKALRMPATVRVEVIEEDTQLYAYGPDQRSYPRAVFIKDGPTWHFHGHGADVAWREDGVQLTTIHC